MVVKLFECLYSLGAVSTTNARFGQGTGPIYLDNVSCSGSESRLIDCNYDPDTRDCGHSEDAGVVCLPIRESYS